MYRLAACALALLLFLMSCPVQADVVSNDHVETCTVRYVQKRDERCVVCGEADFRNDDACNKKFAGQPFVRRCKTRGASSWNEVWCRPLKAGEPPSPVPQVPPSPGACAVSSLPSDAGSSTPPGHLMWLFAATLWIRRRRKRRSAAS